MRLTRPGALTIRIEAWRARARGSIEMSACRRRAALRSPFTWDWIWCLEEGACQPFAKVDSQRMVGAEYVKDVNHRETCLITVIASRCDLIQ